MNRERHNDAGMDRLLRAALNPDRPGRGDVCPDAEVVAAYAGGGLTDPERAGLEPHLASCGRCQAVLAMTATDALADAPVLRPAESTEVRSWRAWLDVWHLKWLLPAAAAVAAVTMYVATATKPSSTPGLAVETRPSAATTAAPAFTMAERSEPTPAPPPALRAGLQPEQPPAPAPAAAPRTAVPTPALAEALAVERSRAADAADLAAREAMAAPPPPPSTAPSAANVALAIPAQARPAAALRAAVAPSPEGAGARAKGVLLLGPSGGTGFTLASQWGLSQLVVLARVSAVGQPQLGHERDMSYVPLVPAAFEILEVFKRLDNIRPVPSITVWHRGGEAEDATTIYRVRPGDGVQTRAGDEYVLFLRQRDGNQDSLAFEPLMADGFYRLDGERVVIGLSGTPDPSLTRNDLLARLRQLAGTATR